MKVKTTTICVLLTMSLGIVLWGSLNPAVAEKGVWVETVSPQCTTNPVVTGGQDADAGSLRQAVIDACPGSTITFGFTGAIALSTGQITIDKNLTIQGSGAGLLTVRNIAGQGPINRIFRVNAGVTATLAGLTVRDGDLLNDVAGGGLVEGGGGILSFGNLTVRDSIVTNNTAAVGPALLVFSFGGGILSSFGSSLTVSNSIISGNTADGGGGIRALGATTITNSHVVGNTAQSNRGGGIYASSTLTVSGSTISNNLTASNESTGGGGIFCSGPTTTLTNTTVSHNRAQTTLANLGAGNNGAGIYAERGTVMLVNATVTRNEAFRLLDGGDALPGRGGGIYNDVAIVHLRNSIVAGNIAIFGADLDGAFVLQGNNLIGSSPIDPLLAPLADNGGPTPTHALLAGSPAIDAGDTANAPLTDQRGAARVGAADIGAFEVNSATNGGTFVADLPDGLTQTPYNHVLVQNRGGFGYSVTAGELPGGIALITTGSVVSIGGTTSTIGIFDVSVTATNGTASAVTHYRVRFLDSPPPPPPGPCTQDPVVTGGQDANAGSLRQAVIDACPGSTLTFGFTGAIALSTGQITIDKNLTIQGPGAGLLTVRNTAGQGPINRIFRVNAGVTTTLAGLTVRDGDLLNDVGGGGFVEGGGGILSFGNLTVRDSIITDNSAAVGPALLVFSFGGGILSSFGSSLTVSNSIISGNTADGGGGIRAFGATTITNSHVTGNTARSNRGGGIYASSALTVSGSTISNNLTASFDRSGGGGIFCSGTTTTLTNTTVSHNRAQTTRSNSQGDGSNGAGIYAERGTVMLVNATVTRNEAFRLLDDGAALPGQGGGIYNDVAVVNLRNSIVAGNIAIFGADLDGAFVLQGNNLIGSSPIDPLLAPLADNGGPTPTHALLAGSPAIDAGANCVLTDNCASSNLGFNLTTDQRGIGFDRMAGSAVDIGAFEVQASEPNTAPSAANDVYNVNQDSTLNTAAPGVLGNDTDGDTDSLSASLHTSPAHAASFSLNANGSFSYTPTANFDGTDSFTYSASDGTLASNTATVTITVNAINDNPTAGDDSTIVAEDSGASAIDVLGNDSSGLDAGETLTVSSVTQGTNGTVTITGGGTGASYKPNAHFNGADSFAYTISDGNGGSATATVSVAVTAVNDNPTTGNDSATAGEDSGAGAINVLANDSTAPDTGEMLTITAVTQGTNGTVIITGGGTGVSYAPNADFSGSDAFTYAIADGNGGTASGSVTVTVTAFNDVPTMVAGSISRQQNAGIASSLIAVVNDVDDAKDTLVVMVNNSTHATTTGVTISNLAVNALGHVTAEVSAACGASHASFTLTVTDPRNLTAAAAVNVAVTLETTPPVIDPMSNLAVDLPEYSSAASLAVTFPLPAASDGCSTPTVVTSPVSGAQFSIGTTTVMVTATDGVGNRAVSSFTVTVRYRFTGFFQPVSNLPTVNIISAGQGVSVQFSLSGYQGLNVVAPGYPISTPVACDASEPGEAVEETVSAGGSSLSYNPTTDRYGYVWKTNKSWKGTCRMFVMKLSDGSEHPAKFRFR